MSRDLFVLHNRNKDTDPTNHFHLIQRLFNYSPFPRGKILDTEFLKKGYDHESI